MKPFFLACFLALCLGAPPLRGGNPTVEEIDDPETLSAQIHAGKPVFWKASGQNGFPLPVDKRGRLLPSIPIQSIRNGTLRGSFSIEETNMTIRIWSEDTRPCLVSIPGPFAGGPLFYSHIETMQEVNRHLIRRTRWISIGPPPSDRHWVVFPPITEGCSASPPSFSWKTPFSWNGPIYAPPIKSETLDFHCSYLRASLVFARLNDSTGGGEAEGPFSMEVVFLPERGALSGTAPSTDSSDGGYGTWLRLSYVFVSESDGEEAGLQLSNLGPDAIYVLCDEKGVPVSTDENNDMPLECRDCFLIAVPSRCGADLQPWRSTPIWSVNNARLERFGLRTIGSAELENCKSWEEIRTRLRSTVLTIEQPPGSDMAIHPIDFSSTEGDGLPAPADPEIKLSLFVHASDNRLYSTVSNCTADGCFLRVDRSFANDRLGLETRAIFVDEEPPDYVASAYGCQDYIDEGSYLRWLPGNGTFSYSVELADSNLPILVGSVSLRAFSPTAIRGRHRSFRASFSVSAPGRESVSFFSERSDPLRQKNR